MKRIAYCILMVTLSTGALRAQVETTAQSVQDVPDEPANSNDERMEVPPPVSGQTYPMATISEDRSNYLRGALTFTSAYTDNSLGSNSGGAPVSDVSYSIAPSIALDEKTARTHAVLTYAPGFTFYQRESSLNEADHNASIDFQYRLSPHATFIAHDAFQKSSTVFNRPDPTTVEVASGGPTGANFSIISPLADRLSNFGTVGLNYQFSMNGMVGFSGTFSNLHYPNPAQVPGLFDSSSTGFSAFHSLRISKMHYVGLTYEYQRLLAYPTEGSSETQTHALLFFYTLYPMERLSVSFFGGPQHSDTVQPPIGALGIPVPESRTWTPAAGASLSWRARLSSIALTYSHLIAGGGGLSGAVQMDAASLNLRRQLTKTFTGSIGAAYTQNVVLASALNGANEGHTFSATASLQHQFRQRFNVQLGYTRLHQNYSSVAVIATNPDTNRESISFSYLFSRPLGR
jgi:hypothetical protein